MTASGFSALYSCPPTPAARPPPALGGGDRRHTELQAAGSRVDNVAVDTGLVVLVRSVPQDECGPSRVGLVAITRRADRRPCSCARVPSRDVIGLSGGLRGQRLASSPLQRD